MSPRVERPALPSVVPVAARAVQGRRAGVVTRVGANAVDLVVLVAIIGMLYLIVAGFSFLLDPRSFQFPAGLGWSLPAVGFVVAVPYFALCWHMTGRTYGDALFGLRVVNRGGRHLSLAGSLLRALACVVLPIGVLWVAASRANRSVQDVILRTSVVYDWRQTLA